MRAAVAIVVLIGRTAWTRMLRGSKRSRWPLAMPPTSLLLSLRPRPFPRCPLRNSTKSPYRFSYGSSPLRWASARRGRRAGCAAPNLPPSCGGQQHASKGERVTHDYPPLARLNDGPPSFTPPPQPSLLGSSLLSMRVKDLIRVAATTASSARSLVAPQRATVQRPLRCS